MDVNEFADAQKTHYTVHPKLKRPKNGGNHIPFVKLLNGKESTSNVQIRWHLYHQLHSHFHNQVNDIIENIETDLKRSISQILFQNNRNAGDNQKASFTTLFLLGSDSTTQIELPKDTSETLNVLIELTPKESPNVRMMLRRSMFKLYSHADAQFHARNVEYQAKFQDVDEYNDGEDEDSLDDDNDKEEDHARQTGGENTGQCDVSYDLSLVENFKIFFGKDLSLVFNFKDVDSINSHTLDSFIILLESALKHEHVKLSLVFNINTNISNIEKNLSQSTIRLLRRNYHKLDVSSNKGFKYGNQIFQSFLDTVDGKLNLSINFVQFLLDKMANNTNHNLQLLTKILDYSLMSYFFQNPFSVFIDPVNVDFLNDDYLKMLIKCPTFMFFIEGLIKDESPSEEISSLITNKDSTLSGFFMEFLVRENPINGYAKYVASFLEDKLDIKNYNLMELYHKLLKGELQQYLQKWPICERYKKELNFEPIDTIFQELFTLDNNNGLLTQAMFPYYKSNLEDNLLNWERIMPLSPLESQHHTNEATEKLDKSMAPVVGHFFKLYREANSFINVYDFYSTFRNTLPKEEIMDFVQNMSKTGNKKLDHFLESNNEEDSFDKISLALFMQALFDFDHIGIIKTQANKNSDIIEKCIWRGI